MKRVLPSFHKGRIEDRIVLHDACFPLKYKSGKRTVRSVVCGGWWVPPAPGESHNSRKTLLVVANNLRESLHLHQPPLLSAFRTLPYRTAPPRRTNGFVFVLVRGGMKRDAFRFSVKPRMVALASPKGSGYLCTWYEYSYFML